MSMGATTVKHMTFLVPLLYASFAPAQHRLMLHEQTANVSCIALSS